MDSLSIISWKVNPVSILGAAMGLIGAWNYDECGQSQQRPNCKNLEVNGEVTRAGADARTGSDEWRCHIGWPAIQRMRQTQRSAISPCITLASQYDDLETLLFRFASMQGHLIGVQYAWRRAKAARSPTLGVSHRNAHRS